MATTGTADQRRGGPARTLVLVLAVLLTGATIWWFMRDDRPRAAIGQVLAASNDTATGARSTVLVPWGRLSVGVTEPTKKLPENHPTGRPDVRSPWRGSFVGVAVDVDFKQLIPMPRTVSGAVLAPELTLVADGRRYPMTGLLDRGPTKPGNLALGPDAAFVAVAGSPDDLRLEVAYDGQTQTVDMQRGTVQPGRFAELDGITRDSPARSCGKPALPASYSAGPTAPKCTIVWAARVPYVAGLGWAPAGRTWFVVSAKTEPPGEIRWRGSGRTARYEVDDDAGRTTFRLAGQQPTTVIRLNDLPGLLLKDADDPRMAVFQAGAGTGRVVLTVTQTLHADAPREQVAGAPDKPVVPVSWQVAVP